MAKLYSVSELARRLKCSPRDITLLLYERAIPDDAAPLVGGRRLIPEKTVPLIEQALRERQQRREQRQEVANVE